MKKSLSIYSFLLLALILLQNCAHHRSGALTILHTNDMHSQYTPMTATWVQKEPKPQIGGMVALAYHIRQAEKTHPPILLLDAGDIMTGTPISKMVVDSALGGGFMQMINRIGYDAMTIGNHEFDDGQENLNKLIQLARFDVLSANLYKNNRLFAPKPYAIYKVNGLRIGVIGVILTDLFEMTTRKNLDGIRVDDPAPVVQKIIDEIDGKTDLIVLLTHQGVDADMELAQRLRNADVIVGGHSHTRLNAPIVRNDILIVQADSKTRYLGRLAMKIADDKIAEYDYHLIPTWVDSVRSPDPEMVRMVSSIKEQVDREYGRTIGTLKTDWRRNSSGESSLGNFIADVMRDVTATDFAVLNSGGIRKDMSAGPVKKVDVIEILPFTNYIVTFSCRGEQLRTLIYTNIKSAVKRDEGILQISGLRYDYRVSPGGEIEILSATVNDEPIDDNRLYRGATVDFVLHGQTDRYFGFTPQGTGENTNLLLSDVVIDYISKHPQITAQTDGRIRQIVE
ncbi:bifunctional metallophosphatase/5'-nucleotidase [candidate division KSB1 bacterium]|nr:bifunctional metallophosphatase/5'-nucleotidase [candidate division KSB1 bacterium]